MSTSEASTLSMLALERQCPYQPPQLFREVAEAGPITRVRLFDGQVVWAVTGHAATRALIVDPGLSVERGRAGFPRVLPSLAAVQSSRRDATSTLVGTDPPLHTRQRRALLPSLTVRRLSALRPAITRDAVELTDAMLAAGAPADLLRSLARPLVARALSHVLGLPRQDLAEFERVTYRSFNTVSSLTGYLSGLRARDAELGDGVLKDLVAREQAGELEPDEVTGLALILVIAGQDITVNMIALSVLTLVEHPEQLRVLREDADRWPAAVEELLRFLTPTTGGLPRVATADIVAPDGQLIKAGDGVLFLHPVANRDAARFSDPDMLDVRRTVHNHLTFGFGIHQCIGQNLVRVVLEAALSTLHGRIPELSLAVPVEQIPVRHGINLALSTMPVTW
ncbi:cytochrome P450 [Streptomyces sp. NPDC051576]|uniref:cytochrome P450 n=1 Tax=Streptomyces sp. NPDC051576 TaxID=3155803 RepID=UPI00344A7189